MQFPLKPALTRNNYRKINGDPLHIGIKKVCQGKQIRNVIETTAGKRSYYTINIQISFVKPAIWEAPTKYNRDYTNPIKTGIASYGYNC